MGNIPGAMNAVLLLVRRRTDSGRWRGTVPEQFGMSSAGRTVATEASSYRQGVDRVRRHLPQQPSFPMGDKGDVHSARKATTGLTKAARRAGSQLATNATAISTNATVTMTIGSAHDTP